MPTQTKETPTAEWTVKELQTYARRRLRAAFTLAPVRMAVDVFRAGHALSILKEKTLPDKKWVRLQGKMGVKRATVHDAIKVYEHFKAEEALAGLTIMEAKRQAGIGKPKAAAEGGRKRYVFAAPTAANAVKVIGQAKELIEAALVAVKEADLDADALDELHKLMGDLMSMARANTAAKMKPHKAVEVQG